MEKPNPRWIRERDLPKQLRNMSWCAYDELFAHLVPENLKLDFKAPDNCPDGMHRLRERIKGSCTVHHVQVADGNFVADNILKRCQALAGMNAQNGTIDTIYRYIEQFEYDPKTAIIYVFLGT